MPVGGGGGVRPLQPTTQQPQVQQQQVQNQAPAQQQARARSGSTLNNVNNFSSQPVSTDLEQLQQWLNTMKGPDQPPQQTLTGRPQQAQVRPQQQSLVQTDNEKKEQITKEQDKPVELGNAQKAKLQAGIKKLADKIGVREADFARLTHAKATGNDALYNFQLGKLDIPPTSAKGKALEAGLEKLFAAVNVSSENIAEHVAKTIIVDDVGRIAKAADIPPSLAADLGALTHNEQDRFIQLAQATGIPEEKAVKLLKGFEKLGERFDLDSKGLDNILGEATGAVNTLLGKAMKQAAGKLGLKPEVFNNLANSVLTKDTRQFIEIGAREGLSQSQITALLPKVSQAIAVIQSQPVFTGEKLLRFTKDTLVQQKLEDAGKSVGLDGEKTLQLVAALVDGGLESYVVQAKEFNLGRDSQALLNSFESIENQFGEGVLSLSTNNIDSITEQRKAIKEFDLQTNPINWPTTNSVPPPSVENINTQLIPSTSNAQANAQAAAKAKNEVRYVLLTDQVTQLDQQIRQLKQTISPLFLFHGGPLKTKLDNLASQRNEVRGQLREIEQVGHVPSTKKVEEIRVAQELTAQKSQLQKLETLANTNPFTRVLYIPQVAALKNSIMGLEQRLQQLAE